MNIIVGYKGKNFTCRWNTHIEFRNFVVYIWKRRETQQFQQSEFTFYNEQLQECHLEPDMCQESRVNRTGTRSARHQWNKTNEPTMKIDNKKKKDLYDYIP